MPDRLVSIVLPTYNGSRYICRAVRSCLDQDYHKLEVLVVDDGSTDDTQAIVSTLQKDPRLRYIKHEENKGLPTALNTGYSQARGDYLTWTSDDNFYQRDAVRTMVTVLESEPEIDIVYSDFATIDEHGSLVEEIAVASPEYLAFDNCIGPSFLYRRLVYETTGPFLDRFFLVEDYEFWLRASVQFRFKVVRRQLYCYQIHSKSLTTLHARPKVRRLADEALKMHLHKMHWIEGEMRSDSFVGLARRAALDGRWRDAARFLYSAARLAPKHFIARLIAAGLARLRGLDLRILNR